MMSGKIKMTSAGATAQYNLETLMGEEVFNRFYIQLPSLLFGHDNVKGREDIVHNVTIVMDWRRVKDNADRLTGFFEEPLYRYLKIYQYYTIFKEMFIDNDGLQWITHLSLTPPAPVWRMTEQGNYVDLGLYGEWSRTHPTQLPNIWTAEQKQPWCMSALFNWISTFLSY
jgi:hypothetical protein